MIFDHGVTVTRIRRRMVADPYSGEETLGDWSDPDELPIPGCAIAPLDSSEAVNVERELLTSYRNLYAPSGADVRAEDRIRDDKGVVWVVDGMPFDWHHPMTGWRPGLVASLKRAEAVA